MQSNSKGKSSGFWSSLLTVGLGVAAGFGAKYAYDEFNKENQKDKSKDTQQQDRQYADIEDSFETPSNDEEVESFLCPISQTIMRDPVMTPRGITYERKSILDWLKKEKTCPITKTPLKESDLISNYTLKQAIDEYIRKVYKR